MKAMNGSRPAASRLTAGSPLLTEVDAAEYLSLTRRALQAWRYQGRGPKYVKISARAVRYRPEDLESWVETRLRSSTSDPGHE